MLRKQIILKKGIRHSYPSIPSYKQKMNNLNMQKGYGMIEKLYNEEHKEENQPLPSPPLIKKPEIKKPSSNSRRNKCKVKKTYTSTGKDITTYAENKTEKDILLAEEKAELDSVDEKDIREAIRPLKPGEALYNKLVRRRKKKKALPKSVKKRIKKLQEINERNPPLPNNVVDAIFEM